LFQPGIANAFAEAAARNADETREQVLLAVARSYLGLQGLADCWKRRARPRR